MANRFFSSIKARFFSTAADNAVDIGVKDDANARLAIDAGGRVTWGDGTNAADTNLYRDAADVLKTDDTFKAAALYVEGIEIDTTGADSLEALVYDGTKFAPAAIPRSLDDLSDVVITTPAEFQTLEYNGTSWVNAYSSVVTYARNAEATTLGIGTVVYLFGATGDHATVKRADNDSDTTSSKTVGMVAALIFRLDPAEVLHRRRARQQDLPPRKRGRPPLCQRHRRAVRCP